MTKEDQERIGGEADKFADDFSTSKMNIEWQASYNSYIAGATHERSLMEKEKIEAIKDEKVKITERLKKWVSIEKNHDELMYPWERI